MFNRNPISSLQNTVERYLIYTCVLLGKISLTVLHSSWCRESLEMAFWLSERSRTLQQDQTIVQSFHALLLSVVKCKVTVVRAHTDANGSVAVTYGLHGMDLIRLVLCSLNSQHFYARRRLDGLEEAHNTKPINYGFFNLKIYIYMYLFSPLVFFVILISFMIVLFIFVHLILFGSSSLD